MCSTCFRGVPYFLSHLNLHYVKDVTFIWGKYRYILEDKCSQWDCLA